MAKKRTRTPVSTKPVVGEPVVSEPKEKKSTARVDHPVIAALKEDETIKALPDGFDFKVHKVIRTGLWDRDDMFHDHMAEKHEHDAALCRAKAEESRALGTGADRASARRLVSLTAKMAELTDILTKKGHDVPALLRKMAELKKD